LFRVLQAAAALCFIGHGAFGIITRESWLAYFAVVGIGREGGYFFMPLIGAMDVFLGVSLLLRPTKAALAYMTLWALWTASLRPLAGQGFPEFLERAGNYGVPIALLLAGLAVFPRGGWLSELAPAPLDERRLERIAWVLRATTATLLLGHGLLAVAGEPLLVRHLDAIGVGASDSSTLGVVAALGWMEIALAATVLAFPSPPVLLMALAWKVGTELLFPLTGDSVWEFIERAGSYGAPLGLVCANIASARRRISSGLTSSLCCPSPQAWPNGSRSWP
jgi:hypothetical protein